MKKTLICILMAAITAFTTAQGMLCGTAESLPKSKQKDTPIAKIVNDNYVPYNYDNLKNNKDTVDTLIKEMEALGGYVETYGSEEEYLKAQNAQVSTTEYALTSKEDESVVQTVTVMTTPTGSKEHGNYVESKPVSNAVVRLNDIPRYTDRNGEITTTISKKYVELYVEKEGYNPYIEIIETSDEEKVVYLKKPSDDLEISSVILSFDNVEQNVLLRDFSVFNEDEENGCFTVNTNTEVDKIYLLKNGNIVAESESKTFYYNFLNEEEGSNYSIYYVYNGIRSKTENLKIIVFTQKQVDLSAFDSLGITADMEPRQSRALASEGGMFGSFDFDFTNFINFLLPPNIFDTSVAYDRVENKIEILLGYEFGDLLGDKAKWNKGKLNEFDSTMDIFDLDKWNPDKKKGEKPLTYMDKMFVNNKIRQVQDLIKDCKNLKAKKKVYKQPFKSQIAPSIEMHFSVTGAIVGDLTENKWTSKIMGTFDLSIEFGGMFLIAGVPLYWEAGLEFEPGFSLSFNDMFTEDFNVTFNFLMEISGKVGAGIGFKDLLSAGVYGKATYNFEAEIAPKPHLSYSALTLGIYYKICLLFLNFEGPIYDYTWTFVDDDLTQPKSVARTAYIANAVNLLDESDNTFIQNVYQEAQPKLLKLKDGRMLMIWLDDDNGRTSFNRTNLAYSIQDTNGNWSEKRYVDDDGTSDFYPQIIETDEGIFVTWQNTKCIIEGEVSTLEDIILLEQNGEIKVSKFNTNSGKFECAVSLTDDNVMDTYPMFAVKQNNGDPLTIVWQGNSENNILGTTGYSTIKYAVYKEGKWQKSENLVTEDMNLLSYSAGYSNGDITIAAIYDKDKDSSTQDDIFLKVYRKGSIVLEINGDVSSPRFVSLNNSLKLMFYNKGLIYTSSDLSEISPIQGSENVGRYFDVYSEGEYLTFSYQDMSDGFRQVLISDYNTTTKKWNQRMPITSGQTNIVSYSLIKEGTKINYAVVEEIRTESGIYYDLNFGETELALKLEITEAEDYKSGSEYSIFISVKNIGTFVPEYLKVVVADESFIISDLTDLVYGKENMYSFDIDEQFLLPYEKIMLKLYDEDDKLQDEYELTVDRIFYSLKVNDCSYGDNASFELNIINKGKAECAYSIVVKDNYNGHIIAKISSNDILNGIYYLDLSSRFYSDTEIEIELVTDSNNSLTSTSYTTIVKANKIKENSVYGTLKQSLNYAKFII